MPLQRKVGLAQRARIALLQSSTPYRGNRLAGYDAVVLMEVIERLDSARLPTLERSAFAHVRAWAVLVTTPNTEFNVLYEWLAGGTMRHRDHRFEWSREEFAAWARWAGSEHGYAVAPARSTTRTPRWVRRPSCVDAE